MKFGLATTRDVLLALDRLLIFVISLPVVIKFISKSSFKNFVFSFGERRAEKATLLISLSGEIINLLESFIFFKRGLINLFDIESHIICESYNDSSEEKRAFLISLSITFDSPKSTTLISPFLLIHILLPIL